jgi:hypothetical protein
MIELKELRKEDIARRAYALYVQRGSDPGQDVLARNVMFSCKPEVA